MGVRFVSGFDVVGLRLHEERFGQVSQYMHKVRGVGVIGHRDILHEERKRKDKHTQLCVFFNGLLLSNLETLRLGSSEIILVVGHCGGWCSWWGDVVLCLNDISSSYMHMLLV